MQKISPHLWYDKEAKEAAEFYISTFGENSKIKSVTTLHDTPSGSVDIVAFEIWGYEFQAMSAGPLFKFNPSASFHIKCKTKEEVDTIFKKLSEGGKILMELGSYPFSERYGWTEDKYGLSWQIIFVGESEVEPRIVPVLMFTGDVYGKTEEAVNFYKSVFKDSKAEVLSRYNKGEEPDKENMVRYASFVIESQEFGAMDSARAQGAKFNEAISFIVYCDNQKEIDYYWDKLSAVPESEQCGWLKDRYRVSWQIVLRAMDKMMGTKDREKLDKVTQALLKMKKIDIAKLEEAYGGK